MEISKLSLTAIIVIAVAVAYTVGYSMGVDFALSWGMEQVIKFTTIDSETLNLLMKQYGMVTLDNVLNLN